MRMNRIFRLFSTLLIGIASAAHAQDRAAIEQKLTSDYPLTKATADKTDIVTAGAVIVLQKDNLMMVDVSASNPYQNNYKDGRITQNALGKLAGFGHRLPGVSTPGGATRTFVAGEKFWVTKIEVKDNGVAFELFTDAISDIRYRAVLTFPFPKGGAPSVAQIEKTVAEVFKVQPADDTSAQQQPAAPAAPAAPAQAAPPAPIPPPAPPADAAPAPIPPPPPPADEPAAAPKTISLGQTRDQVIANLGQPQKDAKVGTKEILYYKELKVTLVNGKVSDVQ